MSNNKRPTQDELLQKLQTPGPTLNTPPVNKIGAPVAEMGIPVTLDNLRPYDRNPRTSRNPKYDEIKASIRAVGLKNPPVVTQRPGDDKYMISDGGNTRLQILQELYEETGDPRFFEFHCIFRPWISEAHALAGHLSENETRGDLSWIEKSLGVQALKRQLEEEGGETLSQRELARQAKALGFALNQGQISRMLHTVEHIWPTLPLTLESGMGQPQIKQLIAYREACLLIWQRCDAGSENRFDQAWHETLAYFDHEGQTVLPWSMVEDRLLGMLSDETGAHLSPIEHALHTILEYRKRRWSLEAEEHAEQVWGPLDAELQRMRNPDAPPLDFHPPLPKPGEDGHSPSSSASSGKAPRPTPTPTPPPVSTGPANDASGQVPGNAGTADRGDAPTSRDTEAEAGREDKRDAELDALRQAVERLEEEKAALEDRQHRETLAVPPGNEESGEGGGVDGALPGPGLAGADGEPLTEEERQQRLDELTLSPHHEAESHRKLRAYLARQHGEEPIDFEDNALRSIPLMSGGPMRQITDIWAIEPQYRGPRELRLEIAVFAQSLGRWAGFNLPGDAHHPIMPTFESDDGLGFTLQPLTDEQATPRAQKVWQLLASLIGEPLHPVYATDVSLAGELLGTAADDDALPDEILVRFFRIVRLMRVLSEHMREGREGGES